MLSTLETRLYHHLLDLCRASTRASAKPKFLEPAKFNVLRMVARKLYRNFYRSRHSWVSTNLPTHMTVASIIIDSHSPSLVDGRFRPFAFYGSLYRATKKYKDNLT